MMVNRPILDRYNEDGSGPAMVADSTRTHMAAGQEREREGQKEREEGKRKGKKGGAKKGGKKKEQKERGRRRERKKKPPDGEEGENGSARVTLLCIRYIYIYVICMCVEGGDCSVRERS
jgi:hypothetical protein